ncbi:MAG: hypothetical protein U0Q18_28965 [Bryobacteraceae bacterium]
MATVNIIAGAVIMVAILVVLGRAFLRVYLEYRGDRVITCPENQRPAGVRVNAGHALLTAFEGHPDLRLKSCSRWPEMRNCGQQCLQQIEASPEECLVRNILEKWYAGKKCTVCGKLIGEIHWADHKPALLNVEHKTVQWQDVAPEKVPEVLASHQPVCWNCHIVNSMITQHPELVVDRSRTV